MKLNLRRAALGLCSISTLASCTIAPCVQLPTPRPAAPCVRLMTNPPEWARVAAIYGPLDYVGLSPVGEVRATATGQVLGYALAEDATVWTTRDCALSNPAYDA